MNLSELSIWMVRLQRRHALSVPNITAIWNAKMKTKFGRNPDSWQYNWPPCSVVSDNFQQRTASQVMRRLAERNDHAVRKAENCWAVNDSFYRRTSKTSWVGADDSFERRMADVAESFVNRRVQFYQLWTNAAQIMSDNNRDVEQVRLHSLQGQTRHMNKTIESVNFLPKKI